MINKNFLPLYLIGVYPLALIVGTLISETITLALTILFIIEYSKNKKSFLIKDPIIYFLFFIWLYLLINLFLSINFDLSLTRSLFFFRHIFLVLSISYFLISYYEKAEIVFKLWMITIMIIIIDLYIQFFFGQNILGFKSPWDQRLSGFFNQELKVAHLLIGFFLPAFAFFLEKSKKKIILYICLFLYFIILILTNERANIIRGTITVILFFIFLPYLKTKFKLIFCSSLLVIFFSTLLLVEPIKIRFVNEISSMSKRIDNNKSFKNYVIYSNYGPHYLSSIEIFKDNKLYGTGLKTFRVSCKNISIEKYYKGKPNLFGKKCSTHPHQYYFEILSELGLIGFVIFISFFFYLIFRLVNNFILSKNLIILSAGIFFILQLIPFLPTGSFFTSFGSTIFFINLSLIYAYLKKRN